MKLSPEQSEIRRVTHKEAINLISTRTMVTMWQYTNNRAHYVKGFLGGSTGTGTQQVTGEKLNRKCVYHGKTGNEKTQLSSVFALILLPSLLCLHLSKKNPNSSPWFVWVVSVTYTGQTGGYSQSENDRRVYCFFLSCKLLVRDPHHHSLPARNPVQRQRGNLNESLRCLLNHITTSETSGRSCCYLPVL